MNSERHTEKVDPIWTSSRTARQILALGEVERTDPPDSSLPHGEERSEQFVLEANEYFERLDQIHISMRSTLAHIRQSRIAPSAIDAPPPNFVPAPAGVGTPASAPSTSTEESGQMGRGLQEERVNRDAWRGILDALTRLKRAQELEPERKNLSRMDTDG
ncbi:uncharacterized protein FOMMEDRAFT_82779 [Fomitiporia mediterranea MF3/22]|uniref:uncharacterized protein n=1 Tax=Fomitiporia mediterranea (strain MF3/22) TaxID=694068 RepID=UPI0004408D17|nr:uncharacterized protein FOMMEDRAFT_82779 [Fomitiporia mediterranea MF3/22]EJD03765.1 hypothetical protein FOMMEDRAFT_82779 [Fomitiporia mediterranea MF3/22]